MILLCIITAVAANFLTDTDTDVTAEIDRLKCNLRFVQYLAMTSNTATWSVNLTAGGYSLQKDGATAPVNFPETGSPTHTFPDGVTIVGGTGILTYDEWGSPGASDYVITFSGGRTVTVTRNTGFIP